MIQIKKKKKNNKQHILQVNFLFFIGKDQLH